MTDFDKVGIALRTVMGLTAKRGEQGCRNPPELIKKKPAAGPQVFVSAGLVAVIAGISVIAPRGGKLLCREWDAAEHFAGVFGAPAAFLTAFFTGHGVVQYRHDELGFPFQPDDGKLPQCHKQLPLTAGDHQRLIKEFTDAVGYLDTDRILTTAGIALADLRGQNHGVQDFHY